MKKFKLILYSKRRISQINKVLQMIEEDSCVSCNVETCASLNKDSILKPCETLSKFELKQINTLKINDNN